MKKLYNYLIPIFLTLFAVAACDEDNEEIVSMSYTDPVATVTKIEPAEGYVGNEFTISGDDFGIRTDDVKVFIGSQAASIISCADNEIVAKVPESATNGKISVVVFGQRVDTELAFRVLGKPGVSAVKPSYGFPGASIVFEGQEFVSTKSLYSLTFGTSTDKAEIVGTPTDTEFTVKVPETAVSGTMSLVMAEQVIDLASYPFTVLKHATIDAPKEGEPIPSGLAGSAFTITGTNLVQELLQQPVEELSPLKVTFTKTGVEPVEAEIDMDGLNDTSIPLTVPASLEAGDYTVTVITPFETVETKLAYNVLPMPVVTGISIQAGYINAEVTIIGQNFGEKVDNIQVSFGDVVCETVTLDDNGNIVVNVPKGTPTGQSVISLNILGADIELGEFGTFEVWETPEITSVETPYVYAYGTLVKAGEEITFVGHGFGTNKESVSVTFEGVSVPVGINSITPTEIAVNVPQGFNGGKVTMRFMNIDEPVVSDKLFPLPENGDITQYVLKNSVQPFKGYGFENKEWDREGLHDWEKTDIQNNGGLQYPGNNTYRDPNGCIALHQWGKRNNHNGKLWQKTKLSKGKYRFDLGGISVDVSGNNYVNAAFVVCEGSSDMDMPGYNNGNWIEKQPGVKGELSMYKQYPNTEGSITVTLDKDTDLVVGFVVWANNTVWATFTSVTVHLVE